MATLAPSRAKRVAISLPIPLAAPVTTATLSFKRMAISLLSALRPLLGQVIVHDLAEAEREIGDDLGPGHDLEHRRLGQWCERVREKRERRRSGPRSLEADVQ